MLFITAAFILFYGINWYLGSWFKNIICDNRSLASEINSLTSTILFLISGLVDIPIGYYYFDLIRCAVDLDYIFTAHHLVSLYALHTNVHHPDYKTIIRLVRLVKFSDLFLYMRNIIRSTTLVKNYPIASDALICMSLYLTIINWIIYRLIYPWSILWLNDSGLNVCCVLIYLGSCWWLYNMIQVARYTTNRLIENLT